MRATDAGARCPASGSSSTSQNAVMIGRLHHVVIDCPNPRALAGFYSELVGLPVTYESDDWVVIGDDTTSSGIAFQLAPDLEPPRWPDPKRPQQIHLDVMVDDVEQADGRVRALGARRLDDDEAARRVFADPSGHPFCLIPRPTWAPPINDGPLSSSQS
jgi:catechol 2,3-dioxygenase-like lactoylglutathione lyase family enzyme